MKRYWIQAGILGCGLLLGFLLGSAGGLAERTEYAEKSAPSPRQNIWVIIEEENGTKKAWDIKPREEEPLLSVMKTLAKEKKIEMKTKEFPGLGIMIEELEGKKNGKQGKYWQYWVNETYAKVGAEAYTIRKGDVVEWKFTSYDNRENRIE